MFCNAILHKIQNNNVINMKIYISVVNYWFSFRPWCPGSTARLTPFQAFAVPLQLVYLGLSSVIVFYNRDHAPWVAVYSNAISPITLPYRLLVSLHIPDKFWSSLDFIFIPFAHCHRFGILILQGGKSDSVVGYFCLTHTY